MAVIDLIYPKKLEKQKIVLKKTAEMDQEDWAKTIAQGVEALSDELTEMSRSIQNIAPIPVGRFDISEFDRCAFV
jgi:hypothetical protein